MNWNFNCIDVFLYSIKKNMVVGIVICEQPSCLYKKSIIFLSSFILFHLLHETITIRISLFTNVIEQ